MNVGENVARSCKRGEGQERERERIEGSSFASCFLRVYIYIYIGAVRSGGYHAVGGMLIYTKRQDLCGRAARLSRNTAPELSRVGRNDTAEEKGVEKSRNKETAIDRRNIIEQFTSPPQKTCVPELHSTQISPFFFFFLFFDFFECCF